MAIFPNYTALTLSGGLDGEFISLGIGTSLLHVSSATADTYDDVVILVANNTSVAEVVSVEVDATVFYRVSIPPNSPPVRVYEGRLTNGIDIELVTTATGLFAAGWVDRKENAGATGGQFPDMEVLTGSDQANGSYISLTSSISNGLHTASVAANTFDDVVVDVANNTTSIITCTVETDGNANYSVPIPPDQPPLRIYEGRLRNGMDVALNPSAAGLSGQAWVNRRVNS